jgi:hypothetical protein
VPSDGPAIRSSGPGAWTRKANKRKDVAMNLATFRDFSQLYRAAYAEADLEKKMVLLREVKKAIAERAPETQEERSESANAA